MTAPEEKLDRAAAKVSAPTTFATAHLPTDNDSATIHKALDQDSGHEL